MKYRELRGWKYELLETEMFDLFGISEDDIETEYINYHRFTGQLYVMRRYAWDGASGPTWDDKTNMRSSLIHDALYQLIREGHLDIKWRKRADELFREICIADGMNKFRAAIWYWVVRVRGRSRAMPEKNPRGKVIEILRVGA